MSYNLNSNYGVTEVFIKHDYYSKLRVKMCRVENGKTILLKYLGDSFFDVREINTDKKLYKIPKGFLSIEVDENHFYFYESGEYSIFRYKYIKHSGSSRSGKTIALAESSIQNCEQNNNLRFTVWRDTQSSLGDTVWKDYQKIFPLSGRKYKFTRNTTPIFFENGSTIEPHGDDTTNAHGLTQDFAWLNEPYKMKKTTFDQIDMRADQIWLDLNPTGRHWSDDLDDHPRCITIHSTFDKNPFCPIEMRLKILSYDPNNPINVQNKTADAYLWSVYGLGLKAEKPNRIFKGWGKVTDDFFDGLPYTSYYATDFGLSAPTAVVEFKFDGDRTFFFKERMYKPLNSIPHPLSDEFGIMKLIKNKENICDSGNELNQAEGRKLKNAGYNMIFAQKGHGSVNAGIETLQKCNVFYTESSKNLEYEYENYSWRIYQGVQLDEPEQNNDDHALDCCRMGVSWYVKTRGLSI